MDDLTRRFVERLGRHPQLLPEGSNVVVALSGGPDSMALLHLLAAVRSHSRLHLRAAHFDHGLRPVSAREAHQVASWAGDLRVPCKIGHPSVALAPTQAALREARYEFLLRHCNTLGAHRLATAHQADDQAETVLFRLLRGTDLAGLSGIPEQRGRIVRPLLAFSSADIRQWLDERGIAYLEDPSNVDPRWTRSLIRHRVLPALRSASGAGARARLIRLAAVATAANGTLEQLAAAAETEAIRTRTAAGEAGAVRLDRNAVLAHPVELRARVLRRAARRLGVDLRRGGTRVGVEFMSRGRSGGGVAVGGGLELAREFDSILLRRAVLLLEPDSEVSIPSASEGKGIVRLMGKAWTVRWSPATGPVRGRSRIAVPLSWGHYPWRIRSWQPGDRIRLPTGSRKLKKVFGDSRVPRSERARLPVLADGRGEVLWVPGLASSEPLTNEGEGGPVLVIELSDV